MGSSEIEIKTRESQRTDGESAAAGENSLMDDVIRTRQESGVFSPVDLAFRPADVQKKNASDSSAASDKPDSRAPTVTDVQFMPGEGLFAEYADGSVSYENIDGTAGYTERRIGAKGDSIRTHWGPTDNDYYKETINSHEKVTDRVMIPRNYDNLVVMHPSATAEYRAEVESALNSYPRPFVEALLNQDTKVVLGESMDKLSADGTLQKHGVANSSDKAGGNSTSFSHVAGFYDITSNTVVLTRDIACDAQVWNPSPQYVYDPALSQYVLTAGGRWETQTIHAPANHVKDTLGHELCHALEKRKITLSPEFIAAHQTDIQGLSWAERQPANWSQPAGRFHYLVQDENPQAGRIEAAAYLMPGLLLKHKQTGLWSRSELEAKFPRSYATIVESLRNRKYMRTLVGTDSGTKTYRATSRPGN